MRGSAVFSKCGRYRYALRRIWTVDLPAVMFIGLNPSTATAATDDPTLRRCIRFAQAWGFGSLVMTNLFAMRSTDPAALSRAVDPIGPRNNWWLAFHRGRADAVVAAWGAHGTLHSRGEEVIRRFRDLHCLGLTRNGQPRHPLYLPGDLELVRFNPKIATREASW